MVTICLLHTFFHTNDAPHHLRETSMQLWSHSMKTSLHYHIRVYIHVLMLLQRWFSAFGEISIAAICTYFTYLHSCCLRTYSRQTYSCKRERFRVPTWAPYNRKTFTIRGEMINEICAQKPDDHDDDNSLICIHQTWAIPSHVQLQPISTNFFDWVSEWFQWLKGCPSISFDFLATFLR
jgi:hypothetical protein